MLPLKAVLILIIVLGHFVYYTNRPVFSVFHELGTSAVSMFFFMSGFGCLRSWQLKGQNYLDGFFKSRILGILLPAVVFLVLHTIWKRGFAMPPQYWFLWVVLFDYVLFWCCYRFLAPTWRLPVLLAGSLLFMAATFFAGFDRCWWICGLSFPTGCLFANVEDRLAKSCAGKPFRFLVWLMAGVVVFAGAYLTRQPLIWPICYIGIPWTLALLVSVIPLDSLKLPVLGFLGTISYEMYLSHVTVLDVLHQVPAISAHTWAFVVAVLLLTIAVSYAVHRLCSLALRK